VKELWYRKPAQAWEETLPLGAGSIGAMVFGETRRERIGLNQDTLWSGSEAVEREKRDRLRQHTEISASLEQVRHWIREGELGKAEKKMEQEFLGEYTESYLPAGDLWIESMTDNTDTISGYRRSLCLDDAVARCDYSVDTVRVHREAFTSYPARAFIFRQTCSEPMSFKIRFETPHHFVKAEWLTDGFCAVYRLPEHVDPNYLGNTKEPIVWSDRGRLFNLKVRIIETDGCWEAEADTCIRLSSAGSFTLMVSIVDHEAADKRISLSYDELKNEHIVDYRRLYRRSDLCMPGRDDLPTDERLQNPDPGLYALYYAYGRYLMIASSRRGTMPANLQGIWCWQMRAPWSSNYTANINLEMNYWPALPANLAACDEAYLEFIKKVEISGRETAAFFGCKGSCCGHNTDRWIHTDPVGVASGESSGEPNCLMWAFYLMAEIWMDQEIWRYYWYHPSEIYLKDTVYPLLASSVRFALDWLTEQDGCWVTSPSTSPENRFYVNKERYSISCASAMDMSMISELLLNYEKTVEGLRKADNTGSDMLSEAEELLSRVETVLPKLHRIRTNRDGSVSEWFEEMVESEKGHRHLSHLYGLFPSDIWREDPKMREAAAKSLKNRMENGGGHTGWSLAWVLNLYVVLKDRTAVERYLRQMTERSTYPNLWDKHPPFQIDGNFGLTAAIAHMLAEEKEGTIELMPCVPESWQEGQVSGLCLPGNKVVSFTWKKGKVISQEITEYVSDMEL